MGEEKAKRSLGRLFTLSVLAGAFIGLGGMLSITFGYGFPGITADNPGLQRLLSGMAFPVGLFLIVMFGADLFTGNNALLMTAHNDGRISTGAMIRNWILVWLGNFVGCLLFLTLFVTLSGLTDAEPYRSAACRIAEAKASLPVLPTLLRAIAANWCVCLAVWLALGAQGVIAKAVACWIPVSVFVALGYEHSVANMFFLPCGMMAGADVTITAALENILLATVGNIIGGALMVGHLLHRLYGRRDA